MPGSSALAFYVFSQLSVTRLLRTLDIPTLWLTGAENIAYSPFLSDIRARLMPKAEVVRVPAPATRSISSGRPNSTGSWTGFSRGTRAACS
jgi:hypothetical protein